MTEQTKPTQQALFDRFVSLYHEQATINLDIKALTDEFKEYYPDAELATIKSVAKAKAEESLGSKIDKAKLFEEVAETFVKWVNLTPTKGSCLKSDSLYLFMRSEYV